MLLSPTSVPLTSAGPSARERVALAWSADARVPKATVAVLMTGSRDPAAAARGYRTVLPSARIFLYAHGLTAPEEAAARAAGAVVRPAPPSSRDALVRRMLGEVDADIYVLAHGAGPEDVCVAPLVVAEVDAGCDLVDVARVGDEPAADPASCLLRRAVDLAFGGHAGTLDSDFKACSRRFALSYRRTPVRSGGISARELALHALRLRLPVKSVTALASGAAPGGPDAIRGWRAAASTLAVALRLLVEERPRRVLGSAGLVLATAGFAEATPVWANGGPRASSSAFAALALLGAGSALGAAGLLLDVLGSARQQVRRLGPSAIPRRADRAPPPPTPGARLQSSVS